jgi:hypothetical protein
MVDVWRVKSQWSFEFVKVVAEKVTAASIFIEGSRVAKASDGVRYFEDFDSAKEYARTCLRWKAEQARKEMESAEEHLRHVESVTACTISVSTNRR